jgi:hypothetical protein
MSLEANVRVLRRYDIDFKHFFRDAVPPEKIMLYLLARQVDVDNDILYQSMPKYNPFAKEVLRVYARALKAIAKRGLRPQCTREMFGESLKTLQEIAAEIINKYT